MKENWFMNVNGKTLQKMVQNLLNLMNMRDFVQDKLAKISLRFMKMETFQNPSCKSNQNSLHFLKSTVRSRKTRELTIVSLMASSFVQSHWNSKAKKTLRII